MSGGKDVFHKKPLGRRWYLISSPIKGCEFSTITSGTERKRGFDGILPCRSDPFLLLQLPKYHLHSLSLILFIHNKIAKTNYLAESMLYFSNLLWLLIAILYDALLHSQQTLPYTFITIL